jgi:Phage protein (N4 Gp49/phage Sf6 gene 66) family
MMNITSPRPDTDETLEAEIRRKGKTAPRVTPEALAANIVSEHYFTAADGVWGPDMRDELPDSSPLYLLTFCVLVLKNGFTVTGESACASLEKSDAEIGRRVARNNAEQKIWPLMGYALREQLSREEA